MELSTEIRDRESALAYLYGRIDYERALVVPYQSDWFKLDRMRELLDRLGNPQHGLPAVHLAGTKGKGSTAAMIAAALAAAGYRTGLYTSPHLQRVEERFVVNGEACPPARLVELARDVRNAVDELDRKADLLGAAMAPTFFEITTAMAFLHFARSKVDAAVLEVGLGGRLDSTNVCEPRVSVVTSISYDHTKQLGNTLAAIAAEKAGIIKPGVPVISGVVEPEPRSVVERMAREQGGPLFTLGNEFDYAYSPLASAVRVDYRENTAAPHREPGERHLENLTVGLLGRHQAANAAVAIAALMRLVEQGWQIPESAIREGLANVRCPSRVEVVSRRPTVVLDVAHNVAAIAALCQALDENFPRESRILIFAASRDKDVRGMLRLVLPRFNRIVLTRFLNNPRTADPESLLEMAEELRGESDALASARLEVAADPESAWRRAIELSAPEHLICVTGSFFIAAEVAAVRERGRA